MNYVNRYSCKLQPGAVLIKCTLHIRNQLLLDETLAMLSDLVYIYPDQHKTT